MQLIRFSVPAPIQLTTTTKHARNMHKETKRRFSKYSSEAHKMTGIPLKLIDLINYMTR